MKSLIHLFTLCLLLGVGFTANAQQTEKKEVKKIVIIKKEIDANGNEKVTKIIKEGEDINDEDLKEINEEDMDVKIIQKEGGKKEVTVTSKSNSEAADTEKRAFLGVQFTINGDTPVTNCLVAGVMKDSPAEKAGLKVNDIITSINGQKVENFDGLSAELKKYKANDQIAITYERDGKSSETKATLEERSLPKRMMVKKEINVQEMMDKMNMDSLLKHHKMEWKEKVGEFEHKEIRVCEPRPRLGVVLDENSNVKNGVAIEKVTEQSAAEKAGIKAGDVILSIDNQKVNSVVEVQRTIGAHKIGDKIEVEIQRNNKTEKVNATLEKNVQMFVFKSGEEEKSNKKGMKIDAPMPQNDAKALKFSSFNAYPNPNEGVFTLNFKTENPSSPITVKVTDTMGKEIFREEVQTTDGTYNQQINLSDQPSGTYIVTIIQNDKTYTSKVVLSN